MKKGIVILLVALALIVLVSPAIVGRLAEKSVDENLNWAAQEAQDVVVTSQKFDRGWFSSEGQHRVEFREGQTRDAIMMWAGTTDPDELPVLLIDTRIDHGIIPVTSMTREKGTLAPGLGSAVSTLGIEMPGGETFDLPGVIYSNVGLSGDLESNYIAESGSFTEDETTASWGAIDITFAATPSDSSFGFGGTVEALDVSSPGNFFELHDLSFTGTQRPSGYGFYIGDASYDIKSVAFSGGAGAPIGFGPFAVDGTADISGGEFEGSATVKIAGVPVPNIGELTVDMDISMGGIDPAAMGKLIKAMESVQHGAAPGMTAIPAESEFKDLLSNGLEFSFDKLNVTLPQGTLESDLRVVVQESDRNSFEWTSLLLATEGEANIRVPEALMDFILEINPQAGAVVGMGYLKKNGDVYEMQAAYKKGLLTINGAPMPIPLTGS